MDAQDIFEYLRSPSLSQEQTRHLLEELDRKRSEPDFWRSCCARLSGLLSPDYEGSSSSRVEATFFYLNGLQTVLSAPAKWQVIPRDDRDRVRRTLIAVTRLEGDVWSSIRLKGCEALARLGWRECVTTWPEFASFAAQETSEGRWDILACACEVFATLELNAGEFLASASKIQEVLSYRRDVASPVFINAMTTGVSTKVRCVLRSCASFISWVTPSAISINFFNTLYEAAKDGVPDAILAFATFLERELPDVTNLHLASLELLARQLQSINFIPVMTMLARAFVQKYFGTPRNNHHVSEVEVIYSLRVLSGFTKTVLSDQNCSSEDIAAIIDVWAIALKGLAQISSNVALNEIDGPDNIFVHITNSLLISQENNQSSIRNSCWVMEATEDFSDDPDSEYKPYTVIAYGNLMEQVVQVPRTGRRAITAILHHLIFLMQRQRAIREAPWNWIILSEALSIAGPIIIAHYRVEAELLANDILLPALSYLSSLSSNSRVYHVELARRCLLECLTKFQGQGFHTFEGEFLRQIANILNEQARGLLTLRLAIQALTRFEPRAEYLTLLANNIQNTLKFRSHQPGKHILRLYQEVVRAVHSSKPLEEGLQFAVLVLSSSISESVNMRAGAFYAFTGAILGSKDGRDQTIQQYVFDLCVSIVPFAMRALSPNTEPQLRDAAGIFAIGFLLEFWSFLNASDQNILLEANKSNLTTIKREQEDEIVQLCEGTIKRGDQVPDAQIWAIFHLTQAVDKHDYGSTAAKIVINLLQNKFEWCTRSGNLDWIQFRLVQELQINNTPDAVKGYVQALVELQDKHQWIATASSTTVQELTVRTWILFCSPRMSITTTEISTLMYCIALLRRDDFKMGMSYISKVDFDKALKATNMRDTKAFEELLLELR